MPKKKATTKASPVKSASKAKAKPKAVKTAAAETTKEAKVVKKAQFIAMLQREEGATLQQLIDFTNWKRPSVHGFISNLRRIDKMEINQTKKSGGETVYRAA